MNATQPDSSASAEARPPKAIPFQRKRRERAIRRGLAILAVIAALVATAGFTIRLLIERAVRVDQVEAAASSAIGRQVHAGAIEVSAIFGLVMTDVTVADADTSRHLLRAPTIRVRPSWWQLLQGRFEVASVRVLDGELRLRREPGRAADEMAAWNLARLVDEIQSRPGAPSTPPFLSASNLAIVVDAPKRAYDGWHLALERFSWNPGKNAGECVLTRLDRDSAAGDLCRVALRFARGADPGAGERTEDARVEVTAEFENLPREFATAFGDPARTGGPTVRYDGLNGRVTATLLPAREGSAPRDSRAFDGLVTIDGALDGRLLAIALPSEGAVRFEQFSVKTLSARGALATGEWSAEIEGMKIGPSRALRLETRLSGTGGAAKGKVEWEGPIESLLAMLPPSLTGDAARFHPKGATAGHALVNSKDGATEISVTARGMSLQMPDGMGVLPDGAALDDVRGRVGLAGPLVTLDSLTVHYQGDPVTLSGTLKRDARETVPVYDLAISTPGFAVASARGVLPADVALDGKVAAELRIAPKRIAGHVHFLGNNLALASGAKFRLTSGTVGFGSEDGRAPDAVTLSAVAAEIGSGSAIASGELRGLATDRKVHIRMELKGAELKALSEAARVPLEFSGVKVKSGSIDGTIAVDGLMKAPAVEGGVTLHDVAAEYAGAAIAAIEGPVKFDSTTFRTPGLSARSGDGTVRIAGYHTPPESKFSVALAGASASILTPAVATVYPDVTLAGPVDADLTVLIRKNVPSAEGSVTFKGTDVAGKDDLAIKNLTGSIELHADRIVAQNLAANYLGAPAQFNGAIPRTDTGRFALDVQIGRARLDHFEKFAPEGFKTSGTAEAIDVRVEGTRIAPRVTGGVKLTGATVKTPFLPATLSDVRGDATFSPDSFVTHGMTFKSGGSVIDVAGGVDHFDNPVFRSVRVKADAARFEDLLALLPDDAKPLPKGAILSGDVKIDEVMIDGPLDGAKWNGAVTWRNGSGELPGLKRGITGIEGALKFAEGKAKAEGLKGRIGATDVRIEGDMDLAKPFGLRLKLAIKDADIAELFSAIPKSDAWSGLDFKGRATMTAAIAYAAGRLKIDGSFLDGGAEAFGMPFTDAEGAFKYDGENNVVTLSNLAAAWAGGRATDGAMKIMLDESPVAFDAKGTLSGVKLEEVLRLAGFQSGGYSGLIDGSVNASGKFGRKESVNGGGSFVIRKARFEKLAPLDAMSRALRLDFFTRSTYDAAKGSFTIDKGVVKTVEPDHFRFMGSNFTIEMRGYTSFDGECAYNFACGMQAGLVGNVLTRLQLGKFFAVSGDGGVIRTSGTIAGRIDNPVVKTDLGILNLFN